MTYVCSCFRVLLVGKAWSTSAIHQRRVQKEGEYGLHLFSIIQPRSSTIYRALSCFRLSLTPFRQSFQYRLRLEQRNSSVVAKSSGILVNSAIPDGLYLINKRLRRSHFSSILVDSGIPSSVVLVVACSYLILGFWCCFTFIKCLPFNKNKRVIDCQDFRNVPIR